MKITIWTLLLVGASCLSLVAEEARVTEASARQAVDVVFQSDYDGTEQRYVVVFPEGSESGPPQDVIFYLHGHGSDRWQIMNEEVAEYRAILDVAGERNAICVSPDYRAATSWMGPAAEADVVQIISEVKEEHGVRHVIMSGASMGGTSSLAFAAMHPELVDSVASMNGTANMLEYENFQEAINESYGGTKVEIPAEYKRRSAEYWPEKLTMPVAITASGQDELVPPHSVLRLAKILQALERQVLLVYREEVGHTTEYPDARTIVEYAFAHVQFRDRLRNK